MPKPLLDVDVGTPLLSINRIGMTIVTGNPNFWDTGLTWDSGLLWDAGLSNAPDSAVPFMSVATPKVVISVLQ